ncbi:MAG: fructose-bisphosphate aldolase class I [Desulfobacterales bacterium]|nr:fructose-bisphosphate aldolase class I [Desulfobacterales bacterium]
MSLEETANAMVAPSKGILAADESAPTIKKRFDGIGVESTSENRNSYRELLFRTEGLEKYISGVILFEETLKSKAKDGTPLPELLKEKGIIPGIKCDKGLAALPGTDGEKVTQGLDGLQARLEEYYALGARFSKWRAVITIGDNVPTTRCIDANAHTLARYAAISQAAGLVPIVEPEVLMNGTHDIDRCEKVTLKTLRHVFFELYKQGVVIEGMILKPNMVISALDCPDQADAEGVARATVRCFRRVLPPALPGTVFLSGGQSSLVATENLNAMNALFKDLPWELSFSYGRALQEMPLKAWAGEAANASAAQKQLYHRARCNGLARSGEYTREIEGESA